MPARLRPPGSSEDAQVPPPQIHHSDARPVLEKARLHLLYSQASWSEGPAWWPQQRTLIWSDVVGRRVLGWREDGAVDVLLDATPFINGNAVAPDGRIFHCEHGHRAISFSRGSESPQIVATQADGQRLNAPNDIVVANDGSVWFSEPTFGIENPKQGVRSRSESGRTSICCLGRDGITRRVADMTQPNGVAFSPDNRIFYASQTPEHGEGEIAIFAFDRLGNRLSNRRRFATVPHGIPDGFTADRRGWVWSSSGIGIEVFDSSGRHLATVPTPHLCSNCEFDSEQKRLFITGAEALWVLQLNA
ncbi:SMP-30/gluconolactonase/LRE family protein [Asaia sp. BMEF1]|uniref:SMP-30/gluconolactonase/LRE family protein n=1 Tax=Asaia sp. BMEF1 TaxID=3155932 RepID=UPI003F677620